MFLRLYILFITPFNISNADFLLKIKNDLNIKDHLS